MSRPIPTEGPSSQKLRNANGAAAFEARKQGLPAPTPASGQPGQPNPNQSNPLVFKDENGISYTDYNIRSFEDISRTPYNFRPNPERSFWESPQRIARYHNFIRNAPPGWKAPDWFDEKAISSAYD